MGPVGAYVIKTFDKAVEGKIRTGFEMLVNNFSAGIIGGALAIISYLAIGPAVDAFTQLLVSGVDWLVAYRLLPLTSILLNRRKFYF